jgi:hypothetical protein
LILSSNAKPGLQQTNGIARGGYERTFLRAFKEAFSDLAKHKIKLIVNAGASDTPGLHEEVVKVIQESSVQGYTSAWIEGDSVLDKVLSLKDTTDFVSLDGSKSLSDFTNKFEPIFAHAYLGGLGIAKALEHADVIICGRVSDASMVVGPSVWWHRWNRRDLHPLANALVAGHLIECSNYVCGGNFSGFKSIENWRDIGYPIAEIDATGQVIITKEKNSGGQVTPQTCTAQLVYEIQGPWYYNSDVTADITEIGFEYLAKDRVRLTGVKGMLPPPTTKVGVTALGGYQAEVHYFLVGLDIDQKAKMLEEQIRHMLAPYSSRFTLLDFSVLGVPAQNPQSQRSATVDLRILAQGRTKEDIGTVAFLGPISDCQMQTYPGATLRLDLRLGSPKPIYEYFPTLFPQDQLNHKVNLMDGQSFIIDAPGHSGTKTYPRQQPSKDSSPSTSKSEGATIFSPLGYAVHGRSGDKGSNANVGFWVRHQDEYEWLKSLLSIEKLKALLGEEYSGGRIVGLFRDIAK